MTNAGGAHHGLTRLQFSTLLQVERTMDPEDLLPASERVSRAAVIAYVATYISGLPFQVILTFLVGSMTKG